jgi:hypothetical protein
VLRVARLDNVLQRRRFSPGGTQRQETLAQVRRRRLGTRSAERGVVRCDRGLRDGRVAAGGNARGRGRRMLDAYQLRRRLRERAERGDDRAGRRHRSSSARAAANARSVVVVP